MFQLWGKKRYCSLCKMELKHKYKPQKKWQIDGLLCSDCYAKKIKEYFFKEQEEREQEEREINTCNFCKKYVKADDERLKPKWQWNLENGVILCKKCYDKKEKGFNIERNFCTVCNKKLRFIRYNPKPTWDIKGQLCRECWDNRNKMKK